MTDRTLTTRRAALAGLAVALSTRAHGQAQPGPSNRAASPEAAAPRFTLRAAPAWQRFLPEPAREADLWSFGDGPAAPVIRIRHGEEVFARFVNDTTAPLSLHWHGVRGTAASDGLGGLTQPPVAPGTSFDYRFVPPDAGTFLVRPAMPGSSGEAAGRGVAALLVVEEREAPAVAAEHVMVVRDWLLGADGELGQFGNRNEAALAGRLGNHLTVGADEPPRRIAAPPGSRLRLRMANACNARILRLRFDGMKVYVGAIDGQPTDGFEPLRSSLPFPPGTRYDLFVETPAAGAEGAVTALIGNGVTLAEVVPDGEAAAPPPAASSLPPNKLLPPAIRLQDAVRRDLPIAGGAARGPSGDPVFPARSGPIWTLGGAAGSASSPPLFKARRGQPVVLALINGTGFPQPMHVHGHVVRLLHGLDDGWEPYWLDTLQVPESKVARIAFVADAPGKWAIASTVLERFDTGLWGWFEVT